MFVGVPNPNILMPLEKMTITVTAGDEKGKKITVLYNPEQYVQSRSVNMTKENAFGANGQESQVPSGDSETLSFTLFFDTMSAGAEVGGSPIDKAKFAGNSMLPSAAKMLDVRDYTQEIYNLMRFDTSIHSIPPLKLEWSSLQFYGYLAQCTQTFTKFNEKGMPVRATMECVFHQVTNLLEDAKMHPFESPDTTKYRTVVQGDSLWAMAVKEYGQPEQWRTIASANGLANPRRLRSGERLVLPAID